LKIYYTATANIPSRKANSINVMKMCQAFVQAGYDVELVIPKSQSSISIDTNIWEFYGISKPFSIRRFPFSNALRGVGFYFLVLVYILWKERGLIYTRDIKVAMMTALLGIDTVYEAHQPSIGGLSPFYFRILQKCSRLLRIVIISNALKDYFCTILSEANAEKLVLAHDAVNLEEFLAHSSKKTIREELGFPENSFLIGYAGHLYPGKGLEVIFELTQKMQEQQFVIVGGIPSDINKWREKTKDFKNIKFTGFVPNGQVKKYLWAFDVLLMPYQKRVSGSSGGDISNWMSPLKMFEYMASRRPIVASDLPVIKEILEHERNALLVGPSDIDNWVFQIKRLMNDKDLRETLAQKAWEDVSQNYTWNKRVEKIFSGLPV